MATTLTTKNSMLWWLDEPGGILYALDCYDMDELKENSNAIEILRCWNQDHTGWDVIGETVAPAEKISVTVSFPRFLARSILESGDHCPGALIWTQNLCGRPDNFTGADIGEILQHVRRTGRAFNAVANVTDTPTRVTLTLDGWPPLLDIDTLEVARIVTTEAYMLNDVAGNLDLSCPTDCGTTLGRGENVQIACQSSGVGSTADVLFSNDYAETFALSAPDPFVANKNIMSVFQFPHGTGTRVLVGMEGLGAGQGLMAFTDVLTGAGAWTTVNIGGAAVGHGPVSGHSIFALDEFHIWVASYGGYIYKSTNAGTSFRAVESGIIGGDYYFIHFADSTYGLAGAAAGVIAVSDDGGETWTAGGIPFASVANCGWRFDDRRCLVGLDNGSVYKSANGGLTWTLVPTGFPALSSCRSMWFVNDYQGFLTVDWNGPLGHIYRTNDGGATWQDLAYVANAGLNSIWAPSASYAVAVGAALGGTGVILKVNAAYV
jgi:hypothetical protein